MTALVLNTDGAPVSLMPLSTKSWRDAISDLILDKIVVLEWYDDWIVHSANWETRVPAVIMLKEYEKRKTTIRYSKQNVFLRDAYICQYCSVQLNRKTATLDHVLPTSHGGRNTFENTVCACGSCNAKKGNDKRIKPQRMPSKPTYYQLMEQRKKLPFDCPHPSWPMYIGIEQ